jgi:hypothetical protein
MDSFPISAPTLSTDAAAEPAAAADRLAPAAEPQAVSQAEPQRSVLEFMSRMGTIAAAGMLLAVPLMAQERPPRILQIYRDSLKRGSEAAFKAIEEDAARICADLKCPNPHLAIESLTEPKEVWWLTPYESEAEKQRVATGYANNPALMAALDGIGKRKKDVTAASEPRKGYDRCADAFGRERAVRDS